MLMMLQPLRKYAVFSGRARRLEFWSFLLFVWVVSAVLLWLSMGPVSRFVAGDYPDYLLQYYATTSREPWATIAAIFSAAMVIPGIAVMVRRLHDIDRSGWWSLIGLTVVGSLILFVFALLDGTRGPNRFGPDPKGRPTPMPDASSR